MLQLILSVLTSFSTATADEPSCDEQAFESAVNYCYDLYHYRSQSFAHCKLGVAHTYEALLLSESTSNADICRPTFLRSCDSGRKMMLIRYQRFCK